MKVKPKFAAVCSVEAARVIFPKEKIENAFFTKHIDVKYSDLLFEPISFDEIQPTLMEGESITAIVSLENKETELIEDYCIPADDMRSLIVQGLKVLALTGDLVAWSALEAMKAVNDLDEDDLDEDDLDEDDLDEDEFE